MVFLMMEALHIGAFLHLAAKAMALTVSPGQVGME
jgi:hypothetical protein